MKTKFMRLLPYLLVFSAAFYLLPFLMWNTGGAMIIMLILIPFLVFLTSVACGLFCGFQWILPISCAVLFSPTVWMYYNDSALIYTLVYGILSLLGNVLGSAFHRKK